MNVSLVDKLAIMIVLKSVSNFTETDEKILHAHYAMGIFWRPCLWSGTED
jgi:hypothetical protein